MHAEESVCQMLYQRGYTHTRLLSVGMKVVIFVASHTPSGQKVVVKVFNLQSPLMRKKAGDELKILHRIPINPHVVPLIDVVTDNRYMCIITPQMEGGDLCEIMFNNKTGISEDECRQHLVSATMGLRCLQGVDVAHG
jgi:serine/threonine protein kinase